MTLQSSGTGTGDADIRRLGPWFHNLHLPDGSETAPDHPLGDFPFFKWSQIAPVIPEDLTGRRALDIGCNAGFYTFKLAERGAHVVAIDHDEHYLAQARWAARKFGLDDRVELRALDVYDLAHVEESFDLVLFMGVLYHLRYPMLALDIVSERVGGQLVVQTLTLPGESALNAPSDIAMHERHRLAEPGWPKLAFVEHELAGDPTNWWVPNKSAVEAMLRTAGLQVLARPGDEIWLCEPAAFEPAAGRRQPRIVVDTERIRRSPASG
jgi:tRNA (mo5U34)-methyltransferase